METLFQYQSFLPAQTQEFNIGYISTYVQASKSYPQQRQREQELLKTVLVPQGGIRSFKILLGIQRRLFRDKDVRYVGDVRALPYRL